MAENDPQTDPQNDSAVSADPVPAPQIDPAPEPEPIPAEPPKVTDWRDREIHRLRDQVKNLRAVQQQPTPDVQPTQASLDLSTLSANREFQRLVQTEAARQAQEIAATNEFNRQCQKVLDDGRKGYSDFDQRVSALKGLVDFNDQGQAASYNAFLIAAIETGDAPRLLQELGSDPNEASRVMSLPPVRMAVELAKMAGREPQQQTAAPRPIIPVTRTSSNRTPINPDDADRADQLSTREWMDRRNKQVQEARTSGR